MLRCSGPLYETGKFHIMPQVWVFKDSLDCCDSFGQELKNLLDGMITCQGQLSLVRLKEVGHIEGSCGIPPVCEGIPQHFQPVVLWVG